MTTALLDADYFAFRFAASCAAENGEIADMRIALLAHVEGAIKAVGADTAYLCGSCSREDNFRRDWYPPYKTNRTSYAPPQLFPAWGFLEEEYIVIRRPRIEADDIIGIMMTNGKVENPVSVSPDKDMLQVPGRHYCPRTGKMRDISPEEGEYAFLTQWLTGDSSDGYPGIPGVGPKKAERLLAQWAETEPMTDCWWEVMEVYREHYQLPDEEPESTLWALTALAQARCARILTAELWDSEKKEVIPWTP